MRDALAQIDVEIRERLVQQQSSGAGASARASAIRCCCRRTARADRRRMRARGRRASSIVAVRRAASCADIRVEPERDVLRHGEMREQRVVLEHHADAALLGRHLHVPAARRRRSESTISPPCTGSKPAMHRRTVVLPQPEGPSRHPMRPGASEKDSLRTTSLLAIRMLERVNAYRCGHVSPRRPSGCARDPGRAAGAALAQCLQLLRHLLAEPPLRIRRRRISRRRFALGTRALAMSNAGLERVALSSALLEERVAEKCRRSAVVAAEARRGRPWTT